MRKINNLVYHCTAGSVDSTVEGIKKYWREVLGWKSPGYHVIIERDGTPVVLAHINDVVNGAQGHNHDSIHISYIGGVEGKDNDPVDNRTFDQIQTQIFFGKAFKKKFPRIKLLGHRDFKGVKKDCPCFDVESDLIPYIEDGDQEDLFQYDGVIEHPFFKLIQDIKRKKPEGLNAYEKSLYDAFLELTE